MPELAFGFVFFNPIACLVLRTGLLAYGVTKHGPCGLGHRAAIWIYKTSSVTHERLFSTFRILLAYKDLLSTLCVLQKYSGIFIVMIFVFVIMLTISSQPSKSSSGPSTPWLSSPSPSSSIASPLTSQINLGNRHHRDVQFTLFPWLTSEPLLKVKLLASLL